ncbi:MAG: hypothetical protein JSS78_00675 [Bacteroidetes bacterium]|nr:hypothetical protein [Bacteroidota bacterium]
MKNLHRSATVLTGLAIILTSCSQNTATSQSATKESDSTSVASKAPISLEPVVDIALFPNAQLSMNTPTTIPNGDSAKINFTFNVKNYKLMGQTTDSASMQCSNSKQGQHIHFILDNKPYAALYEPKHEVTLSKNSEHYLMAFLSRSYHLSLKEKGVAVLYHFKVDAQGKIQKLADPTSPMLFYSRPKGDYIGNDVNNVLLDFYVWNATLGNDFKVKADIHSVNADTTFTISEWKPYFLRNLPMGKTTIHLSLLDKAGNPIIGENTTVSRDINLAHQEPLK